MKTESGFAVALMAGGKSVRMGRDKARLEPRAGRELWRDRLALLRETGAEEILISCRPDQEYLTESGARLVFDQWPETGPLGGIVSCLEVMAATRLLVLAVDLPGMTKEGLDLLLRHCPGCGQEGAVFKSGGFWEPLAAVYPKAMALSGRRRLEAGAYDLRGWIAEAGALMREVEASVEGAGWFVNLNDPEAWEAWRQSNRT